MKIGCFKKLCYLLLILSLIYFLVNAFKIKSFYTESDIRVSKNAVDSTRKGSIYIEEKVKEIQSNLQQFANELESKSLSDDEMKKIFEEQITKIDLFSGLSITYAPFAYDASSKLHSLYVIKQGTEFKSYKIEDKGDYTDGRYEWYNQAIGSSKFVSKPVNDEISQNIVIYISVPVIKKEGDFSNKASAVLTVIWTISDMQNVLTELDFGSRGTAHILDKTGNFIINPSSNSVNNKSFSDFISKKCENFNKSKFETAIKNSEATSLEIKFKDDNSKAIISLEPVKMFELNLATVLNKVDLGFPNKEAKSKWMLFVLSFVLLTLFLICSILLSRSKKDDVCNCCSILTPQTNSSPQQPSTTASTTQSTQQSTVQPVAAQAAVAIPKNAFADICTKNIYKFSAIAAIILFAAIFSVWAMELIFGLPAPKLEKGYISDRLALKEFIDSEIRNTKENGVEPFEYLPAGVLVKSVKIIGVNEAEVSGIIWQKIPKRLLGNIKEGFRFPDAVTSVMEEIYRINDNNNTIIGWNFKTMLRQSFNNTRFPFEQLQVKLLMCQKNVLNRIQFIPDFKSYEEYSSASAPFASKDITVPGWEIKQTYFTIQKPVYQTTFGQNDQKIKSNVRDMVLNITLHREFLSNFFSTFLPFFVLILLAFIALLMTSAKPENDKVFNFKPSNMQGIASGFVLFLVFSIIGIRGKAISNNLLYVEYLYFFTFLVVLSLISVAITIFRKTDNIIGYEDGILIKALYWPFILGTIYLITFINFY